MVKVTRTERMAAALRSVAGRCRHGVPVGRMLALALVLEGRPRSGAADRNGMDPRPLRDRRTDAATGAPMQRCRYRRMEHRCG